MRFSGKRRPPFYPEDGPEMDFTSDLRSAVISRVSETGCPPLGHGSPFIRTQNWRDEPNGTRESWILRFLLR